jgi:uncharacterized protein (TIGR01777 family)
MNPPLKIVLPGGSGHVGTLLARHFHAQGHSVTVLSRAPMPAPWNVIHWDGLTEGPWTAALEGTDLCINLAGRSVNCRYHAANRRAIYDSRILSTQLLGRVIHRLAHPPRLWMNSSTATIYRHSLDRPMDEATGELGGNEPGAPDTWNFSIRVAKDWEAALFAAEAPRTRKIALRSAVTLSAHPLHDRGSIFDTLSTLVRRGLGGTNGSGRQMVSWVHCQDFLRAIDFLIAQEDLSGIVNIASPNPLPNRDFMRALREAWGVPVGLPAPAWLIEIGCWALRTESELVLKSRNVIPGRLQQAGFKFDFPEWPTAAADLVHRWRTPKQSSAR